METPPGFNLDQAVADGSLNPTDKRVWAPRVFWLLFGFFAINASGAVLYGAVEILNSYLGPAKSLQSNGILSSLEIFTQHLLQILLAGYCLVRGVPRFVTTRLATRVRVAVLCAVVFLFLKTLEFYELLVIQGLPTDLLLSHNSGFVFGQFASSFYSLCLIVPMIWLSPFAAAQKNIPANPLLQYPASFNLEQAVAAWRAELARQPGLIPSDLKELEAHLRDAYAELRKNHLAETEAFFVAQQRVGAPIPVAAEFAKAAPRRVWSRRLFWLAFGLFCSDVWLHAFPWLWIEVLNSLPVYFDSGRFYGPATWAWLRYIPTLVTNDMPILIAAIWLARSVPQFVSKRLTTRRQVAMVGGALFFLANFQFVFYLFWYLNPWFVVRPYGDSVGNGGDVLWQICLLALMVWLTPRVAKAKARPSLA